jgi:hypothetical protein
MYDYWQKQSLNQPLFPNLLWSRPENKLNSGRLLIIGGSASGINETSQAYIEASRAGIGLAQVILPDKVKPLVGNAFEQTFFATSNKSGGFAKTAIVTFAELSENSEGILITGQLGHNSETNILIDTFISEANQPVTITSDSVEQIVLANPVMLNISNLVIVCTLNQLQKLATKTRSTQAITSTMPLNKLAQFIHDFTKIHKCSLLTRQSDYFISSYDGEVVTTSIENDSASWQISLAAHAIVLLIQNKTNRLGAISCAALTSQAKWPK